MDCYFENIINLKVNNQSQLREDRSIFTIDFIIKESDRFVANFDPIAEELWNYFKQYKKSPEKFTFSDNLKQNFILKTDNEQHLSIKRRNHIERLKEKKDYYH